MKGLLYKEWATLTSSYKQSVFFFAFLYGGISILTGQTGMAYGLLVIFSILITSTISFDENSHWDIYVRTLPVTPAQLVGSKYLFGLCGLALGTVYTVLIVALNNVLPPLLFWHTVYKVPPLECLAALLACGSMALLLVALLLPLSYRFNSVKARSWLFLIIGVLGGCFGLVASVSPDLMQLFNASDEVLLTGLVAAFVGLLAVYFVSYKVCAWGFISGRNTEFLPQCALADMESAPTCVCGGVPSPRRTLPLSCGSPAGEQCSPLQGRRYSKKSCVLLRTQDFLVCTYSQPRYALRTSMLLASSVASPSILIVPVSRT